MSVRSALARGSLIGVSQILVLLVSLLRTKVLAVLLGPAGMGLMGTLNAMVDLARCLAELGINSSGVRQMAAAAASNNMHKVEATARLLRRLAWGLGAGGALMLLVLAQPLSQLTFGDAAQAGALALLGLALLLRLVSDAQGALLQGLRRSAAIAHSNVAGAVLGAVLALAIVAGWGEGGIAPSIVAVAAASCLASWWASRKLAVTARRPTDTADPAMSPSTASVSTAWSAEAIALIRLGLAFMASSLFTLGAAYAVRVLLIDHLGLQAAGLYQTAATIGGLAAGLVLQALATDYYPRLVEHATTQTCLREPSSATSTDATDRQLDAARTAGWVDAASPQSPVNRLVNEQAQLAMLLALPCVLATLALAPIAVGVLYSDHFLPATDTLRWICLGAGLRVLSWPLGWLLVAGNRQAAFMGADLGWALLNVLLTALCLPHWGLTGAGMAWSGAYLVHLGVLWLLCRRGSGLSCSPATLRLALASASSLALALAGFQLLAPTPALVLACLLVLTSGLHSAGQLRRLMAADPAGVRPTAAPSTPDLTQTSAQAQP
ncbi:MAG: hypothetical protein RIQ60_2154 [Pseudomonadota bacterium]